MNFGYELFPVVSINSGELVFNISYPVSWKKPENEIKPLFKFLQYSSSVWDVYSIEDFGSSRFTECISIRIHRAVFQYIQKHITPNSKLYASGTSQFTDTKNGQSRLHENMLAPPQGRDFVTYFTVETAKCKSEQMSLSLRKKWIVAITILSSFSVNWLTAFWAEDCSQFERGCLACRSPWEASVRVRWLMMHLYLIY